MFFITLPLKIAMAYLNKTKGIDPKLVNKAYDKAMSMKKGKGKCSLPCTKNGGKMKCKCYK